MQKRRNRRVEITPNVKEIDSTVREFHPHYLAAASGPVKDRKCTARTRPALGIDTLSIAAHTFSRKPMMQAACPFLHRAHVHYRPILFPLRAATGRRETRAIIHSEHSPLFHWYTGQKRSCKSSPESPIFEPIPAHCLSHSVRD